MQIGLDSADLYGSRPLGVIGLVSTGMGACYGTDLTGEGRALVPACKAVAVLLYLGAQGQSCAGDKGVVGVCFAYEGAAVEFVADVIDNGLGIGFVCEIGCYCMGRITVVILGIGLGYLVSYIGVNSDVADGETVVIGIQTATGCGRIVLRADGRITGGVGEGVVVGCGTGGGIDTATDDAGAEVILIPCSACHGGGAGGLEVIALRPCLAVAGAYTGHSGGIGAGGNHTGVDTACKGDIGLTPTGNARCGLNGGGDGAVVGTVFKTGGGSCHTCQTACTVGAGGGLDVCTVGAVTESTAVGIAGDATCTVSGGDGAVKDVQAYKGRLIGAAEETATVEGGVIDLQIVDLVVVAVEGAGEGLGPAGVGDELADGSMGFPVHVHIADHIDALAGQGLASVDSGCHGGKACPVGDHINAFVGIGGILCHVGQINGDRKRGVLRGHGIASAIHSPCIGAQTHRSTCRNLYRIGIPRIVIVVGGKGVAFGVICDLEEIYTVTAPKLREHSTLGPNRGTGVLVHHVCQIAVAQPGFCDFVILGCPAQVGIVVKVVGVLDGIGLVGGQNAATVAAQAVAGGCAEGADVEAVDDPADIALVLTLTPVCNTGGMIHTCGAACKVAVAYSAAVEECACDTANGDVIG